MLMMWGAANGGLGGGVLNSAQFILPLGDLGAGAVSTNPQMGVGPATFTRATAAATKLSTGLWKLDVASGTARSAYIGLTTAVGAYGGYLAEGAATQLVTPSASVRDMTDASWAKVTMTTAKTSTGIDGVANSCTRLTAAGAASTILQTLVAAGSSRTYSCWMRRVTGTGTILIQQGATTLDVTALINSATFTLVQLNANVLNSAFGITINTNGDAVDVDCNQFEAGAFATTPIPSAGVRNGDMLTFQFSGNALAASGSAYAECYTLWATSAASGVAIGFGNAAATTWPICVDAGRASTGILCRDGTNAPTKLGLTDMNAGSRKRASSWGAAGLSVTGDGAAPATSAFDGDEGSTAVAVGCNTTDATTTWYGAIKNVRLWQSQLPDGLLSQITNGPA